MKQFTIVGLGEVLWDVFPTHKQLGGAPTNFAYISRVLGDNGVVASRTGADGLGMEVKERVRALGLNDTFIQVDPQHATGTVRVEVKDGQPRFEILEPVAWDFLEWTPQWEELARNADAVCFGSLAQRGPVSRATIRSFVGSVKPGAVRVFDINLRQSYFSPQVLKASAANADILKLNHEEVATACKMLGAPSFEKLGFADWLCREYSLKLVCITCGAAGSVLVCGEEQHRHPGYPVQVVDTVGAGDAFTAALVHHYMRGSSLAVMNDAANRMGSLVASKAGATPEFTAEEVEAVRICSPA
ncbi:MAG TPA: carbohydrate kinase [Terriglobales bacterium]